MEFVFTSIVIVVVALFVARYVRQVAKGQYRDADETKRPWWVVGNGRHGGA